MGAASSPGCSFPMHEVSRYVVQSLERLARNGGVEFRGNSKGNNCLRYYEKEGLRVTKQIREQLPLLTNPSFYNDPFHYGPITLSHSLREYRSKSTRVTSSVLGKGTYGVVVKDKKRSDRAIKLIRVTDDEELSSAIIEVIMAYFLNCSWKSLRSSLSVSLRSWQPFVPVDRMFVVQHRSFRTVVMDMPQMKGNVGALLDRHYHQPHKFMDMFMSIMGQLALSLLLFQRSMGFQHQDLKYDNILYRKWEVPEIKYEYEGRTFRFPTQGYMCCMVDFGFSCLRLDTPRQNAAPYKLGFEHRCAYAPCAGRPSADLALFVMSLRGRLPPRHKLQKVLYTKTTAAVKKGTSMVQVSGMSLKWLECYGFSQHHDFPGLHPLAVLEWVTDYWRHR